MTLMSILASRSLVSFAAVVWSRHATRGLSALRDETKQRLRRRLQGHQTDRHCRALFASFCNSDFIFTGQFFKGARTLFLFLRHSKEGQIM